jgi:O-antigen/teichoic acid export membrane protein
MNIAAAFNSRTSASAGLRLATLPFTGLATLVFAHEIIVRGGRAEYAEVTLIWSLALLVQFADLGTGAAVVNAIAKSASPQQDQAVLDVLRAAVRALLISAIALILIAVSVYATIGWNTLLGRHGTASPMNDSTLAVLLVIAIGLPLAPWPRVLLGHGYNHVVVGLTALASPISLLLGTIVLSLNGSIAWLATVPATSNIVVAVLAVSWINRKRLVTVRDVLRNLFAKSTGSGVIAAALPMWVILVVQPAALQSDRIVLAWRSTESAVATYSLAAQLYMPLLSVVMAAAAPLWPHFAKVRETRCVSVYDVFTASRSVVVAGLVLAVLLVVVGLPMSSIVGGSVVEPRLGVFLAFGSLLAVQAITLPFGMLMTDVRGLRFQARVLVVMFVVNVGLSVLLAPALGDAGPVVASALAVGTCQLVPCMRSVRHRAAEWHPFSAPLEVAA